MYDVILWLHINYENIKIILHNIVVIEIFKKEILQSIVE